MLINKHEWSNEEFHQWENVVVMADEVYEALLMRLWPDRHNSQPSYWTDMEYNSPNQPVVGVCWFEARAYCAWLSAQTGQCFRLPTEAEWEAATRGKTGRRYAWGNHFDATHCNVISTKLWKTTPIGVFPSGDTLSTPSLSAQEEIFSLSDLIGNVNEWTSSCYIPYPYKIDDGREEANADKERVVRGGCYNEYFGLGSYRVDVRATVRRRASQLWSRERYNGFRALCSFPIG